MSLEPLLAAPLAIQIHAFGAIIAVVLGIIQFVAPKGTLPHRTLGVLWVLIMLAVAISSIFVRPSLKPGLPITQWFSFIHIFTVMTFFGLASGVTLLMRGGPDLKRHKIPFAWMYFTGLLIAGGLAFLPGRIMHKVVFGG